MHFMNTFSIISSFFNYLSYMTFFLSGPIYHNGGNANSLQNTLKGSGLAGDFSWFVLNLMVAGGMDEVLI